ncbi:MAG: KEOPS complex subunit Pcc1 [Vulcanisaeta sp. AZ3]|jgi:hypothetical protein
MRIKGNVVLEIPVNSTEDCETVVKALMPDEKDLPTGLSSSIKCDGGKLIYELHYDIDSTELLSVYNTIDDLMRNLKIIINSLVV